MPAPLAATALSRLLGCRLPVIGLPPQAGDVAALGGFGFIGAAQAGSPQPSLGLHLTPAAPGFDQQAQRCIDQRWPAVCLDAPPQPAAIARLRAAGVTVVQQAHDAQQALHAQQAGCHAVLLPHLTQEALADALGAIDVPAAVAAQDGRSAARLLAQGAQAVTPHAGQEPLADWLAQAAQHSRLLRPPEAAFDSLVCYAAEAERQRRAPLLAQLTAALAAQRRAARQLLHPLHPPGSAPIIQALRGCGLLWLALHHLEGQPASAADAAPGDAAALTAQALRAALAEIDDSAWRAAAERWLQTPFPPNDPPA